MTLILGWRDPACLISDGVQTDPFFGVRSLTGPKIMRVGGGLAAGGSGGGAQQPELMTRLRTELSAAKDWPTVQAATQTIVEDINSRVPTTPAVWVNALVAGKVGGEFGILELGPHAAPPGPPTMNPYGVLGSGGHAAAVARSIGMRWNPDIGGEALLRLICETVVEVDMGSGKPIWRIDLQGEPTEPYVWLA
jgi:hypothetical protein